MQGLNKHFGDKHVVQAMFRCACARGEIFGFLGPNGSGKTTTIRMMCGLLKPDSGSGTCLGYDILRDSAEIKRNVGYMTQRFSFWEDLTIAENLDFVARMYEMPVAQEAVRQALEGSGTDGARQISLPARFPADGSSAWRWRPACCTSRNCCCSTSRQRASIRARGATSGTKSRAWPRAASRCW